MSDSGHWIHQLDPKLVHLWGDIGISYYGLSYVLGFVFGVFMHRLFRKHGRSPLNAEQEEVALYAMVLGVLLGARLGYIVLYTPLDELLRDPWFVFQVWKGGMSSHGGFIGVVIACWYVSRRCGITLTQFGDLMTPLVPVGFLLGRIANFINGELWGNISNIAWAVVFPRSAPGMPLHLIPARHPSQLYEAALEGAALLLFMQWRFWRTDAQKYPGRMSGEFLLLYAVFRIVCEQFREPDAALILGVSRGVFYSFFLIAGGLWLIARSHRLPERPIVPAPEAPPAPGPKRGGGKKRGA
ncbi:MAG: prolipoprotein diacylglyceryl transferase [Candidatus Hydrogenedens sp.]|nr:prolipoprotein diacylglyceryl transferase [Candidatus Hydrogenedentota bacterium]NLF56667.1 prolipoprotein diacylglyceryl transferase [Candidatus Hydrogenedens sp.]